MSTSELSIIVVMLDSLRSDSLGCYGNPRVKTPNIDKLAHEGILFEHVIAEQPITVPARNAYSLGMYTFPWLGWEPLPDKYPLLQQILAREGYTTAIIGDMGVVARPEWKFCTRFQYARHLRRTLEGKELEEASNLFSWDKYHKEYTHPRERERHLRGHVMGSGPDKDWGERATTEASLKWVEENLDKKFFLWIDYFCPHEPWDPPDRYYRMYNRGYGGPRISLPRGWDKFDWTRQELHHIRDLYDGDVSLIDEYVGKLLSGIAEFGLDDETILVLISDHGEPLGERGKVVRKVRPILHREQVEVVQILRMPGGPRDRRISSICQNFDLTPTLLSLVGIKTPETMEGEDLSSVVMGEEESVRDKAFCGWRGRRSRGIPVSVRTTEWVYIRSPEGKKLYNASRDPWEQVNLIQEKKEVGDYLDSLINNFLKRQL